MKNIDIEFGEGLTVVTGVSGSGKTSLVFDTLYHEAQRRFLDIYLYGRGGQRLAPAKVEQITGLGPAMAVGQNLLNRNPNSILATASGLHPFFRLLYTNFGERNCSGCGEPVSVLSEDEVLEQLLNLSQREACVLYVPLIHDLQGSHQTLLSILAAEFGIENLVVDGKTWDGVPLKKHLPHAIDIEIGQLRSPDTVSRVREIVQRAASLGTGTVRVRGSKVDASLATTRICAHCGAGLGELRATHFNQKCPYCQGGGCRICDETGMHPQAASVRWQEMRLPELLSLSVDDTRDLFSKVSLPSTADRLCSEITRRLDALARVGLGYLALNRPAPSLSRGESQRVRLAISLSSRLEDMLHVLDEPTIGQHPADVTRYLPAFRDLAGPVVFVEHDRVAAASADQAVDLGPGAGAEGGKVVFKGSPADLWRNEGVTGRFFSFRERVMTPESRPPAEEFFYLQGVTKHNLRGVDVRFPLGRLTVVTGVSGSGKSTLIEHVLLPSIKKMKPIGCAAIEGPRMKPVLVDQSPIGRNPRSNPATYTKLSDAIRDLFAEATGYSISHFSYNRPEGACPACKGIGGVEIKMRYLPSIWLPCEACEGQRFKPEVLQAVVDFAGRNISIAEFYATPIGEISKLISDSPWLTTARRNFAIRILQALTDVGLGYLELGQPSPTLSGGEAQRVKLTKYLGRNNLNNQVLMLDEPSTGLHPRDLDGLLVVVDRLVRHGATIVIVEHNTDFIRAADWVIDLGPGAGPQGGRVLYQGLPGGLLAEESSLTAQALKNEEKLEPRQLIPGEAAAASPMIAIRNARVNNLKGVDVNIPKGKLTVLTGVSGSGKSSLLGDVLQTEARRRYLESISMYERQGTKEGAEAQVDSITGLGVTLSVAPQPAHTWSQIPQFTRRNSVGAITEISFHLATLLSWLGERTCFSCGTKMVRGEEWVCPNCAVTASIAQPRHFSSAHWSSSCKKCSGLGELQQPQPEKLIIYPEKPLCAGAMYSPGYWPQSYLCKDQPIIVEIGKRYGFDPMKTPWNEMSQEARNAFLFGDGLEYTWTYVSKGGRSKGQERQSTWTWRGFYSEDSWLFDWDVHGTYTRQVVCSQCGGAGLRPEYLAVTLQGKNVFELSEIPLDVLESLVKEIHLPQEVLSLIETSMGVIRKRLRFLRQVGLGYLHLNRPTGTLSAGEAQRIQLASLLGNELTALTILIDEPSRGMHPCELEALRDALQELCEQGNTVIVVEHDPVLMRAADHIIDLGPGAGIAGGEIVAQGQPGEIIAANTITGEWLRRKKFILAGDRRPAKDWMVLRGARENNLRGEDVAFPLGTLTGICGVSGSGKSSLLIDTLGRALVQKLHSTSFAHEPINPGDHDGIDNPPKRAFLVDQTRRGIFSPAVYLGFEKTLLKLYADSDDAQSLGLTEKALSERCSACRGQGVIRIPMDFLPDEWLDCETCRGTGFRQEAWEVCIRGVSLPQVNAMTIDEVYQLFEGEDKFSQRLDVLRQVGLGYLVWKQAAYTLSGGEVQRLKIAKELIKKTRMKTLYILDEPTVGLHLEDVARLVGVLNQLVDAGHTVLTVEHHPHLLAACDWLIELGPVGGPEGGKIIACGSPEEVMKMDTPTAPYLRELLEAES
ncbi:MAG: ATP-binding cassette domain-containing protein [Chloroflexota bacterium]|nr:MAG: ATP-binding cassette domain-containing protein [Chloroflexota bacterium]